MARKNYGMLEDRVIQLFQQEGTFSYGGSLYNVLLVGKPRPASGECKTDVYILGQCSNGKKIEIKISVKTKSSNEFQGNKLTAEDAEAYFGLGWQDIIEQSARSVSHEFESRPLIYVSRHYPVKANSITLGWKLEIASKSRSLSAPIQLTNQQIRDYVYKGLNQPIGKKNSFVCGKEIADSGVAKYLLVTELNEINSTDDVLNKIEDIDIIGLSPTYLIFTSNNYRTMEDSADGPRFLAVTVNWRFENGKLIHEINYSHPLEFTGENDIKPILLKALQKLGKSHPCEFNTKNDIANPNIVLP